jgi:type II secretory pathway pseudopilin PulG
MNTRLANLATTRRHTARGGFTLAEVLAALLFMAIVIPTAIQGVRIAARAGAVGERKTTAIRIAEQVLNDAIVTGQFNESGRAGTVKDGPFEFRWTLNSEGWTVDNLRYVSVEVAFTVQGADYTVTLGTLADDSTLTSTSSSTTTTTTGR